MKILLPIDSSITTKETLRWLTTTFNFQSVKYYLISVIPQVVTASISIEQIDIESTVELLQEATTFLQDKGFQVAESSYVIGEPVDEICQYADHINADNIVLGSHGKAPLEKVFLGSVSSGVLEKASIPVIVYKPKITKGSLQHSLL